MAKNIYVPLYAKEKEALIRYADQQDRDPRVQAARFIREGLKAAGALPVAECAAIAGLSAAYRGSVASAAEFERQVNAIGEASRGVS